MEFANIEATATEQFVVEDQRAKFEVLNELELALIGGGVGDIILG